MANAKSYQYFDIAKPILPYKSYTSPVDESPHFIQGSQNIMASQIGYLQKRPGFNTPIETTPTTLAGEVKRLFGWRRWNGHFFIMSCTVEGGFTKVYKYEQTVDTQFVLIWTSTSDVPFDFIVSDNFCFFGNETDMRKFDGTTVSKWGLDAPAAAPPIAFIDGTLPPGMTFAPFLLSGTPTVLGTTQITINAVDATGATASVTYNFTVNAPILTITSLSGPSLVISTPYSGTVNADYGSPAYVFSLFSGSLPTGLSLAGSGAITGTPTVLGLFGFSVKVTDSLGHIAIKSFSLFVSSGVVTLAPGSFGLAAGTVGTPYAGTITASTGTAPYTFTVGIGAPPGLTFTNTTPNFNIGGTPNVAGTYAFTVTVSDSASHVEQKTYSLTVHPTAFSFVPTFNAPAFLGYPAGYLTPVDGGIGPYTYTITAGTLDAQTGYQWGYTYTSIYGHESNMSELSVSSGLFTGEDVQLTLIASPDLQVNGINLYRTTDGGTPDPAIMRLLVSLPNNNQSYIDSTLDKNLGLQTGPGFLINTPPTPTRGFVWSNGRIYGMTTNKTYYSGLEEVSNGIPEEAWPSGLDGNVYAWPAQVGGMAVTENGVDIALSEQVWQIAGDSLDTFRKSIILDKAGVGSPTCISAIGNSVQWVDSAKQIWSSSLGEIGESIRLDLATIEPNTTYIGYHKSGNFNWIYTLDSLNERLYIYDLDTDQWYPPWTVAASAIWSGETSVGVISLLVAINGIVYSLNPNQFLDGGNEYEDDIKLNLIPISPGRTTSARSKMQPTQVEEVMFEMGATNFEGVYPSFVGQLCDDDPILAPAIDWFDLTARNVTPQFIPRRKRLMQFRYIADSTTDPAIRAAFWFKFAASAVGWKIYSLTVSWIKA